MRHAPAYGNRPSTNPRGSHGFHVAQLRGDDQGILGGSSLGTEASGLMSLATCVRYRHEFGLTVGIKVRREVDAMSTTFVLSLRYRHQSRRRSLKSGSRPPPPSTPAASNASRCRSRTCRSPSVETRMQPNSMCGLPCRGGFSTVRHSDGIGRSAPRRAFRHSVGKY